MTMSETAIQVENLSKSYAIDSRQQGDGRFGYHPSLVDGTMRINIHDYLAALQSDIGGGAVAYCPNPGNAGDALIAQATFQAFHACGLHYQLIDPQHFIPQDEVVIYAGGGNLCRYYREARNFIQRIHRSVRKLIILPHTIEGNEALLAVLGRNVDIICREMVSYQHVQRHVTQANVYLADDMAFALQTKAVLRARLRRPWHYLLPGAPRNDRAAIQAYLRTWWAVRRTGVLHAFRIDCEATDRQVPKHNYDLSSAFAYGTLTTYPVLRACVQLLRLVGACRQLQTDRLHVAIAGALLGREVLFYANSYYKNQGVYDLSMAPRFPHVYWMGPLKG
jgi:exopolysaccharide biosynthesis predicted pyruvyltransferase EpsI